MFRQILYSESEEDFDANTRRMLQHSTFQRNDKYKKYFNKVLLRRNEWSLEYRLKESLPTNQINTTNLAEVSFRLTKDVRFNRLKAHNVVDFLEIVLDKSDYYMNRCVDAATNTLNASLKNQQSRYLPKESSIDSSKIIELDSENFLVPSETKDDTLYEVNIARRECSCFLGRVKGPCKHKNAVAELKNVENFDVAPIGNARMRSIFMYLGTGKNIPQTWFEPVEVVRSSSETNPTKRDSSSKIPETVPSTIDSPHHPKTM